ncbi:MAG: 4Fe-4S binding protein [Desulfobacteraceae bacterium]|nr:4Fe-4S binding protein [Desulfobacterales bacterium]MBL6967440.1 4Fe-4S binding protein [Desulfobacteraceae bacterium]MBL7101141.1 4Fe-4S binding protein [Desulfobacteraceae bacterium]MBL7171451.1 4Fe-4S binding protein [Desulfobacteraceae bacterium]
MAKRTQNTEHVSYVYIDESLCNGCVLCMKACPTKAIRVKEGNVARIEGVCIDCWECARVCPKGAIKAITSESLDLTERDNLIVSPSTVLYSQFGEDILPNDVLLGLKKMGFGYIHDQSYTSEIFSLAIELYIKENRKKPNSPFPFISPVCPVVVSLIAYRFSSLLEHIPPLITPREIVAREGKARLSARHGGKAEEFKVLHITPCPSKMICMKEPILQEHSYLDATIGINSIYEMLRNNIQDVEDDIVLHHSGGIGLSWGMSGGEISGVDLNCLAVSGLQETIHYLEKIEMGLLGDIDYVEFRACAEGCLGGPFTVMDKYRAKRNLQKLVRMFGIEKRIKYGYVKKLYEKGWFFTDKSAIPGSVDLSQLTPSEISEAIERQNRLEDILRLLPRKECGACGSPDCRTFAEDVVDGRDSLRSCVFWEGQEKKLGLSGDKRPGRIQEGLH